MLFSHRGGCALFKTNHLLCVSPVAQVELSLDALQVHVLVGGQDLRGVCESSKDDVPVARVQLAEVIVELFASRGASSCRPSLDRACRRMPVEEFSILLS